MKKTINTEFIKDFATGLLVLISIPITLPIGTVIVIFALIARLGQFVRYHDIGPRK